MKVPCGVLTLLSLAYGAEARCSPTSYYKNCWIRRYPGVFIDVEESQRRGGQLLLSYREDSALMCSRACCLTRNFSCNLAIFHYDTVQQNCYHLHCPTLESCILSHRGNFVLYNITKGVDPDLLVFGKHFTSNLRVLPHLYTRMNGSEPLASDKRQFSRPLRQPSPPVTPAASGRTRKAATGTTATAIARTLRTPVQPTTFSTTVTPPTALSHPGKALDPVSDGPRSQTLQSVPSHPVSHLTRTITTTTTTTTTATTTTTSHLSLARASPPADSKGQSAEAPPVSRSPAKQHPTSSRPPDHTLQSSSPAPRPGTEAPAAASDPPHTTTETSAATAVEPPMANGESGDHHAAANATLAVSAGRNHTAAGGSGVRPWSSDGDGAEGLGTEWQAHTLLVVVVTCATALLSCCGGVLLALGLRGRRRRKGRYQTAWRRGGGSMRLIKYVLIREGS